MGCWEARVLILVSAGYYLRIFSLTEVHLSQNSIKGIKSDGLKMHFFLKHTRVFTTHTYTHTHTHTHTLWTNCSVFEMVVAAALNGRLFLEWSLKFLILKSRPANS